MLTRAQKLERRRLAQSKARNGGGSSPYRRPSHEVGENAMPPPLVLNPVAKAETDVRALESMDVPSVVPPVARLTIAQMDEIERLAALQMNLFQIGVALRIGRETWAETVRCNPLVGSIFIAGQVRATVEHAEVARELALEDRDPGMVKFWLAQHGGPQWSPKAKLVIARDEGPVQGLEEGADVMASVDSSAEEQRKLLGLLAESDPPAS